MSGGRCNARTPAHAHDPADTRRYARPTASLRGGNSVQLRKRHTGAAGARVRLCPCVVAKCGEKCKKVAKSFGGSRNFCNFAAMKEPVYIITGINQLTRQREQLSRPMSEKEASERLQREVANRKFQRHAAHTRLKMERLEAVQLTIRFDEE